MEDVDPEILEKEKLPSDPTLIRGQDQGIALKINAKLLCFRAKFLISCRYHHHSPTIFTCPDRNMTLFVR